MTKEKILSVLAKLRCVDCHGRPTPDDVIKMYADFGYKIKRGDELVRRCRACADKRKN